ncbi:hypothetical protein ACFFRR_009972 [Megaselia abdita]
MKEKPAMDRKEYMRQYMRSRREDPKNLKSINLSFREVERVRDAERKRLARSDIRKLEAFRAKDAARKRLIRSGQLPPKIKKCEAEEVEIIEDKKPSPVAKRSKKAMATLNSKKAVVPSSSNKVENKSITSPKKDDEDHPRKVLPIKLKIRLPITHKNKFKKK